MSDYQEIYEVYRIDDDYKWFQHGPGESYGCFPSLEIAKESLIKSYGEPNVIFGNVSTKPPQGLQVKVCGDDWIIMTRVLFSKAVEL